MRARILTAILLGLLALAACGGSQKASTFASAHPSARASISQGAHALQTNTNVRADEQAAMNCLPNATSLSGISRCEHTAFPKGGFTKAVRCAATQVVRHLFASVVVKRHAIAVACGGIR